MDLVNVIRSFNIIAETMGINTGGLTNQQIKKSLIQHVTDLKKEVGITKHLEEKGVNGSDIPILSGKAIKDACIMTNPRQANIEDIKTVYREAM